MKIKQTNWAYVKGLEDGKKNAKRQRTFTSGMEQHLYNLGYDDAQTENARH